MRVRLAPASDEGIIGAVRDVIWIAVAAAALFRVGPVWLAWAAAWTERLLLVAFPAPSRWAALPLVFVASCGALFGGCYLAVRFLHAPRILWAGAMLAALPFALTVLFEVGIAIVVGVRESAGSRTGLEPWRLLAAWAGLALCFVGGTVAAAWLGARTGATDSGRARHCAEESRASLARPGIGGF